MLGKIQYASSKYEKLIRATIPITDENSTLLYVLLLSFDPDVSNFHEIITKKIIPFINESKANLKRLHGQVFRTITMNQLFCIKVYFEIPRVFHIDKINSNHINELNKA